MSTVPMRAVMVRVPEEDEEQQAEFDVVSVTQDVIPSPPRDYFMLSATVRLSEDPGVRATQRFVLGVDDAYADRADKTDVLEEDVRFQFDGVVYEGTLVSAFPHDSDGMREFDVPDEPVKLFLSIMANKIHAYAEKCDHAKCDTCQDDEGWTVFTCRMCGRQWREPDEEGFDSFDPDV